MKVTISAVPKILTSTFLTSRKFDNDEKVLDYSRRMKEFIFGKNTLKVAAIMGLDIFNLVFVKNIPFREYINKKLINMEKYKKEDIMTGMLINCLYRGKPLRLLPLSKSGDNIIMNDIVYLQLSIIDMSSDYKRKNKWLLEKYEKNSQKDYELSKTGLHYIDTIRMGILKYYMKSAINKKEFIDKVNFRRFSNGLRLNNRPASIEDINSLLRKRRNMTFVDLTDNSSRLNLSALYAIVFKNADINDIYDSDEFFSPDTGKEKLYSEAASEFITTIYNGNGIEISDVLIKMAEGFSATEIPDIEPGSLTDIIDNFNVIYAIAAIAYKFDKAFTEHEMLKKNMRQRMIDRYWTVYCNIIQFKKFGSVVAFCYLIANLELDKYRDDKVYFEEICAEFEATSRAVKEIKEEVYGV